MTGRGKHTGVRDIFQGGGLGGSSHWVGDVGDEPPHGTGPGVFPEQVGPMDDRKTATVASGRKLGVPPLGGGDGGGNVGGGFGCGGGVCLEEEEYGRSVLIFLDLCE